MPPKRSVGAGLLLAGAAGLTVLMTYTMMFDGHRPVGADAALDVPEVAVFLTQPEDWADFRLGVGACVRRGLVRLVREEPGAILVQTRGRRALRFTWQKVPGVVQAREELRRLLSEPTPPLAVVGSDNTILTAALAHELRRARTSDGPILMVPWATSIRSATPDDPGLAVPLLEIYPGRTFRICPNNRHLADLVVRCLAAHEPSARPARVLIEVDEADPYSIDLSGHFRRAIGSSLPGVDVIATADQLAPMSAVAKDDDHWASEIWDRVRKAEPGQTTWLVLPLQREPALRLLRALRSHAARLDRHELGSLRVLCGDGVGAETLAEFADFDGFTVWCGSVATAAGSEHAAQVPAEIISALAWALDQVNGDPDPATIRAAFARLRWGRGHPSALGRPLAFEPSGERRGKYLGGVLATRPDRADVVLVARSDQGRWTPPLPIARSTAGAPR